ncbi:hypothetical protein BC835DRAFT_1305227 [Cytidiella melzeri]|nr:hypothetical protein BC835DRAFT_1305227 [Cytidiella melzeri]
MFDSGTTEGAEYSARMSGYGLIRNTRLLLRMTAEENAASPSDKSEFKTHTVSHRPLPSFTMKTTVTLLCLASIIAPAMAIPTSQPEQVGLSEWELGLDDSSSKSLYVCFGVPNMRSTYDCANFYPAWNTCEQFAGEGYPLLDEVRSVSPESDMTCDWFIGSTCGYIWGGPSSSPIASSYPKEFSDNPFIQAMGASFKCTW